MTPWSWRSPHAAGGGATGAASSQPGLQPWQPDRLSRLSISCTKTNLFSCLVHPSQAPQKCYQLSRPSMSCSERSSAASRVRPAAARSPAHVGKRSERIDCEIKFLIAPQDFVIIHFQRLIDLDMLRIRFWTKTRIAQRIVLYFQTYKWVRV